MTQIPTVTVASLRGSAPAEFRLAAARAFLRERFVEPITIAELAVCAGMTRWSFVRSYHKAFGITPHREMLDLRVALAQRLLADPSIPVEDIATASGFGSRTALYRNFVHRLGRSPLQWRDQRVRIRNPIAECAAGATSAATGVTRDRGAFRG